ncbi:hypothetical protein ACVVIH_07170 [Chryseobacterium arthrosphaerae]|uniref:hypothetical protein n=1 Tax=Chryseobacterium arthrosphaerae TaxID=651561 RepID=UPI003D3266D3
MKKIRDKVEHWILSADQKWKTLPQKRQRLFTMLFLAGYTVLTILVLISIFITTANDNNTMSISHITTISDHTAVKRPVQDNRTGSTIKK